MFYLFDTNILIEAKNRYYGFDITPGFWDFLEKEAKKTTLKSNDFVLTELKSYGDDLSEWVADRDELIFDVSSDEKEIQEYFKQIANYVNSHPIYSPAEKARFLAKADPWLIAAGKHLNATIVTHEVFVGANSKIVKIPNVAQYFGVDTVNTFEMIRSLGGKFGLIK